MEEKTVTDLIAPLLKLQDLDRRRDRLQKKLDEVPRKLRKHTEAIAAMETAVAEREAEVRAIKAEADRIELEMESREAQREKIKGQMNAPKLSNREYEVLQDSLAGVLADINKMGTAAIKGMQRASEAEEAAVELRSELEKARTAHAEAKAKLEGALGDVRAELDKLNTGRAELRSGVHPDALSIYEKIRRKHGDALAVVEGTIDRAAGRIGNDLHCATCFMTATSNDAVHVLGRKRVVQCRSCARILYVP